MAFINRKNELGKLNSLWLEKKSQLVVIYGKRRVGKTELIKQFLKDGKGIYYLADKRTLKEQLLEFARVVGDFFDDSFVSERGFSNWIEVFSYLKEKSKNKNFAVAIDEYPYLVETDSAVSSVFQKGWDEYLKKSGIYLILCGSSMSMMESELLSYKAPLYGRLTTQILVEPMDFIESQKFFKGHDFISFMSFYSVTGGMPAYMQAFAKYKNVTDAIKNLCWDKFGLYHNEVNSILKQELRTPNNYFAILKAIARGHNKLSEITNGTGLEPQLINKYMDNLIRLQLVQREIPITEEKPHKSKKGFYKLSENFVRFWFQYVYAFSSDLEIGNTNQVIEMFRKNSNILESIAYEQIAREHMYKNQNKIVKMDKVGRYWNKLVEIDGIGLDNKLKQIVIMDAKWSNSKISIRELNKLKKKSELIEWNNYNRREIYMIYSKSGFESDLVKFAKENDNLFLVHKLKILK